MSGQLFTHYFLEEGIRETDAWKKVLADEEAFVRFREELAHRYEALCHARSPNEAMTEQDLVRPLLDLLGWHYLPQQTTSDREDIPDHLLFVDADSRQHAAAKKKPADRYRDALVVQESKRFGLALDTHDKDDRIRSGTPHRQILRYLSTAEIASDSRIRWGILTNGSVWRLYDYRARPRDNGYFEADLADLLKPGKEDELRVFYLLFRRESFVHQKGATATFLERALAEGKRYEEQVAEDLSQVVFGRVFPDLVDALATHSKKSLSESRDAALIFLYRLLFVLYAEDRGLLPVNDSRYDDYGLRKRVRDDIAGRMDEGDVYSAQASQYYDHLTTLFRLINEGDASIGLPPYNGGLFAMDDAPLLNEVRLPDAVLAPIIYDLSHTEDASGRYRFVNYRDMSVQQLGSIYERLLEQEPVRAENGTLTIRPNTYARRNSGSFYTSQDLVDLIMEQTLKPLISERRKAFEEKAKALGSDRRSKEKRQQELEQLDPAVAVLDLKVLDPAMGSGHFLVTAVDFLSDHVADLIEYVPMVPDWLNGEYVSPLVERVAAIRSDLLQRARESNWVLDEAQLTDQAIIRRMVLKRCIYGVDKNPLTVELARVSLWLHSFTVGAPLSFLDHHLRCGDSLLGLRVADATEELRELGGVFASSALAGAEAATRGMQRIEEIADVDVAEVQESAALFSEVEETTADLRSLLDFFCGWRWLTAGMGKKALAALETPLLAMITEHTEDAYRLLARGPKKMGITGHTQFVEKWNEAMSVASREGFLHWEAAFPGVWYRWQESCPEGGFDAVIGNPPWDRIKLQEVEWFATRSPELARAATAAARRQAIQQLRDQGAALADEFDEAKAQAEALGRMVRSCGDYPLLGGGDINLYSLFVERSMSLIKPDGVVGLLTPSGIYADKTAAPFFQSVSTTGRVGGVFDFENKKVFFRDIDSRFKFCAIILGGEQRQFNQTLCAFFLHDTKTIEDPDRCFPLTPDDFARVNPNTGTVPTFRSRRDAEITSRIYGQHPVLVDRSEGGEQKIWPAKYTTMFHMTNDSHLFRTAAELEEEGFYPVEGNRWKRGQERYLPLYQGRMIWHFDHRANSVKYNPGSTHNPYLSEPLSEAQHADPSFLPRTQYWVPAAEVESVLPQERGWTLGFRDITNPTNERTMIAAVVPWAGYGNKAPLLTDGGHITVPYLVANLNSFCLDFVVRQKIHGSAMNWFIVEQLPVIAPDGYDRTFGARTARDLVRDHVLRLTYTARDLAPFARDLGYEGKPFIWDEEERCHLRARLDALYFHLYGLDRDDAAYVLSTFPIVRRQDEAKFSRYRTRDLILAYMNALAAGDTETVVVV